MSRIGDKPITIPAGVNVSIKDRSVEAKGPLGALAIEPHAKIAVSLDTDSNQLVVTRPNDEKESKALHGLTRSLLNNMVQGVHKGFEKKLEIVGVGYNAKLQGNKVILQIGFCHPVEIDPPEGVTLEVPDQTHIIVKGADKQKVGQLAAEIRKIRPPEPYKGKGIRYDGEQVRRKAGKSFSSAG